MKTLIIDAIIGVGFPSVTLALKAEQVGLTQHTLFDRAAHTRQSLAWHRPSLEALTLEELQGIYEGVRAERETLADSPEGAAFAPRIILPQHGVQ